MMNWIRSFYTPLNTALSGDLASLREHIFQRIMSIATVLGCAIYAALIQSVFEHSQLGQIIFFTLILLIVGGITLLRRVSYSVRSSGALLSIFIIAVYFLSQNGFVKHGQVFLIIFLILSGVFKGVRAFGLSFILGMAAMFIFGTGLIQGSYRDSFIQGDSLFPGLFVAAALSMLPLLIIANNLQANVERQKELINQQETEKRKLENQINQQTVDLERRLTQIRTAAEISRSMNSVLDPDELLQQVVNLLADRAKLYYAGVFLLDDSGTFAVLHAGSGEAGKTMLAEGHRLLIGGSSMVGWSTATRKARVALDTGEDAVHFNNPHLPLTRSELALPIIGKTTILGALTIQSELPNAFDENDIIILQGVADSLAIAIENSMFFQQNQRDMEEIRALNQQYLEHAWTEANARGDLKYSYNNPYSHTGSGSQLLQVPIVVREHPIGKVTLDTGGKELSPEEVAVVDAITTQTALALESARLLEEMQNHARLEEKINQMTADFWRATDIQGVLKTALETIGHLPAISEVSVHLMPFESRYDLEHENNGQKEGAS
jgi:GAF domain-containing protein